MRPPQFAGEDSKRVGAGQFDIHASMRPPQFAGEDAKRMARRPRAAVCFNEAPAVRGGRYAAASAVYSAHAASMRPPQFAGEDDWFSRRGYREVVASMRPPQFAGEDYVCGCRR